MPIQSLKLTNVGPFRHRPDGSGADGIELSFDPDVNLFIGPNNVGKSTILQALAAVTSRHRGDTNGLPGAFASAVFDFRSEYNRAGAEVELVWTNSIGDYRRFWNTLAEFFDGSDFYETASLTIGGPDGLQNVDDFAWEDLQRDFGSVFYHNTASHEEPHGANVRRGRPHPDNGPPLPGTSEAEAAWSRLPRPGMAEGDDDYNVFMLNEAKLSDGFDYYPSLEPWQVAAEKIDRVILEILEGFDVLTGIGMFHNDITSDHMNWREGQYKLATMDGELTFPELSQGTRSVFAWIVQFVSYMATYYVDEHYYPIDNWEKQPGIFIIDEIDAHLHPSWQRRIIPTLQRHFPNVQIFASTHSPMMVAGLKKGQVHLLKRDETGQVVWSRNEQDIIGWTADEIYRTFMGIDDPTDERTARHAEELRELRNKDHPTPDDEARMQELRRLVNEDLLAGGWLKAQDERFDEMMRRFMASRMSDLSQDGA